MVSARHSRERGRLYSYSLFRHEGDHLNPRPAAAAYASVARFLSGAEAPSRVALHKDLYAVVFKHAEGSRAALWTPLDNPVSFAVSLPNAVRITDMLGDPLQRPAAGDDLQLSREPLFLWSDTVPAGQLAGIIGKGRFRLPCAALDIALIEKESVLVRVKNLLNGTLKGRLTLSVPRGWQLPEPSRDLVVAAEGTGKALFRLTQPRGPTALRPGVFSARLETAAHGTVACRMKPTVHSVPRLPSPAIIDGNLAEFADLPAILLDGQTYLHPPDAPSAKLWTGIDDLSAALHVAWDDDYVTTQVLADAQSYSKS